MLSILQVWPVCERTPHVVCKHKGAAQPFSFPQQTQLAWETDQDVHGTLKAWIIHIIHFTCYLLEPLSEHFLSQLYVKYIEKDPVVWMVVPDLHLY